MKKNSKEDSFKKNKNYKLVLLLIGLIILTIGLFMIGSCYLKDKKMAEDKIKIIETVDNVGLYADKNEWSKLEELFSEKVELDYSSFTGQEKELLTPQEISLRWSAFLPGFDYTQHKLSNIEVTFENELVKVHADVRAIHVIEGAIGGDSWVVDGSYDYTLEKVDEGYKISMMRLNFEKTLGNNDLPNIALNKESFNTLNYLQTRDLLEVNNQNLWVKPENPVPQGLENNENIKVVQNFFAAYGNNDLSGIREVMADDVKWYIPGNHKLAGTKNGVEEVVEFFGLLQKASFMAEPMIFAANDDYVIDVHRGYSNTGSDDIDMNWVLVYKIENGKIKQVQNFAADSNLANEFFEKVYTYEDTQKIREDFKMTEKVTFTSEGVELAGVVYKPENYDSNKEYEAIVVTGAWTTVKEQMPTTYAKELAKKGFITFVFDFRGWGESEGKNRYLEDPIRKTEDIKAAAEYLKSRFDVNSNKVGGLGVCASSGYMAKAFSEDVFDSVALVAPWLHNEEIVTPVYGGEESVQNLLATGDEASQKYENTKELSLITAASNTEEVCLMPKVPYYTEEDRGLIPEYDNKFNLASWRPWLTFDSIQYADKLPGKILFVESESMALPQGSSAFKDIAGDNVESFNLENVSQFDFYDKPDVVAKSVDKVAEFMNKELN